MQTSKHRCRPCIFRVWIKCPGCPESEFKSIGNWANSTKSNVMFWYVPKKKGQLLQEKTHWVSSALRGRAWSKSLRNNAKVGARIKHKKPAKFRRGKTEAQKDQRQDRAQRTMNNTAGQGQMITMIFWSTKKNTSSYTIHHCEGSVHSWQPPAFIHLHVSTKQNEIQSPNWTG